MFLVFKDAVTWVFWKLFHCYCHWSPFLELVLFRWTISPVLLVFLYLPSLCCFLFYFLSDLLSSHPSVGSFISTIVFLISRSWSSSLNRLSLIAFYSCFTRAIFHPQVSKDFILVFFYFLLICFP